LKKSKNSKNSRRSRTPVGKGKKRTHEPGKKRGKKGGKKEVGKDKLWDGS